MEKAVWVMSFDVRILPSSPIAMDDSEFATGEAALFAESNEDAQSQLLKQLESVRLQLVELHQSGVFNTGEWLANRDPSDEVLQLIEEVIYSGKFTFGVFRESMSMETVSIWLVHHKAAGEQAPRTLLLLEVRG